MRSRLAEESTVFACAKLESKLNDFVLLIICVPGHKKAVSKTVFKSVCKDPIIYPNPNLHLTFGGQFQSALLDRFQQHF